MFKRRYFLIIIVLTLLLTGISASFASDEVSDNNTPIIEDSQTSCDVNDYKEDVNTLDKQTDIKEDNIENKKINTNDEKNIKTAPATTSIVFSKSYHNANQTVDIKAMLRSGIVGLAGEELTIKFNNDTRTFITDSTGSVNQVYNVTQLGTQTIVINYAGSDDYKACNRTETFERAQSNLFIHFSLNQSTVYVGDVITVSTQLVEQNLTPIANERVNITINDKKYSNQLTDKDGYVNITYNVTEAKINLITAVHERNDWYKYQINITEFISHKSSTSNLVWTTYNSDNYTYEARIRLFSNGKTISGEKFRLIFNDEESTVTTDADGFATKIFKIKKGGEQKLQIFFDTTNKFLPHNKTITFSTYKYNTTTITTVTNTSAKVGDIIPIAVQLNYTTAEGKSLQLSNEPVTIRINNESYTGKTNNKGQFVFNFTVTKEGSLDIIAYYNQGQFKFNISQSKKITINVTIDIPLKDAILKVTAPKSVDTGKSITINLTATDMKNKALLGKAVVKINGLTITDTKTNSTLIPIINGKGSITTTLANYSGKEYNVTGVFSKIGYNRAENTTKMTVTKSTYKPFTLTYNTTSEAKINIKQTIKDVNNNPIYGKSQVAIKLGDRTVLTTTIVNGNLDVNVTVPYLPPGENKFKITLGENYRYTTQIINSTINIEKQNVSVTITPITSQAGKKITLKATLKNTNTKTNVISGKYIFKIDGKTVPLIVNNTETYTTQNISNGIAQWTYTLPSDLKKGVYEILLSYNGNTQSNPIKYSQKALTIS